MGFRQKLASLVGSGTAMRLNQQLDSYYRDGPPEGWFCVYQKSS